MSVIKAVKSHPGILTRTKFLEEQNNKDWAQADLAYIPHKHDQNSQCKEKNK